MNDYELLDSGNGKKLERFGPYTIIRPSSLCIWKTERPQAEWTEAHAEFTREPENKWYFREKIPDTWTIEVDGIQFKISPTDFGHLGIFPEQKPIWKLIRELVRGKKSSLLNLFAYSGGSTLAAAIEGASLCHLDASKGMCSWASVNAKLNHLENAPIRWIVDDVMKFLKREVRREKKYDGIFLDPPTFGRGSKGEVFKIEEDLPIILEDCRKLLSPHPLCIILSCHTPGMTPLLLRHLLFQTFKDYPHTIEEGEMLLVGGETVMPIPSGSYAIIHFHHK